MFRGVLMAAGMAVAAVPALAQEVDRSDWPSSLALGTASQGGTFFIYGAGWGNMVAEELGISIGTEATGGPVQNLALIQTGDLELGMTTMGPAAEALAGESELAPGLVHDQVRALFPMYQTPFQFITLEGSGITSVSEIPAGAAVGVGPAGGTPGTYFPRMLEALGVDFEPRFGGAADLASQLQDGLLDVFAFAAGVPISAFAQLEAQVPVNIFAFSEEELTQLTEEFPVSRFTIEGGTYTSVPEDQETVAMWNFAVAHADLPESLVYEITRIVMTNHDRMMEIHGASAETLPENFEHNTFLPWHPGAVRWFEENGYDIPDDLEG